MSSSARADLAADVALVKPSLRRWSRNLSAHTELDRLNQVERRRQLLELKRQKDLFDQMSSTSTSVPPPQEPEVEAAPSESNQHMELVVEPTQPEQPASVEEQIKAPTIRSQPLTNDELMKFVTSCVPKSKRVLCLIVRDKLTKLNRAKSYFYPTYYLFVQAIVNIDQEGEYSSNMELEEDSLVQQAPVSTENSFSASSSISADMLFIGAANQQLARLNKQPPPGNSYSDNELYPYAEDALDGEQAVKQQASRTAASLQGRDSPLVFPNGQVKVRDEGENVARSSLSAFERKLSNNVLYSTETSSPLSDKKSNRSQGNFHGAAQLSIEDSNEDLDGDNEAASANKLSGPAAAARQSDEEEDNEEDDYDDDEDDNVSETAAAPKRHKWRPEMEEEQRAEEVGWLTEEKERLFDNDKNPYTGTYGVLLAGKKRKKAKTYLIGTNEYGFIRKNSICKLKSNVLGTQFNAIRLNHSENNDRCTIASISYETNVLGFKGPRKMRVFLAKDPNRGSKNLLETFKKNPAAIVQLKNMSPSWNVESQSYVLNFHGRVTQASVKNFQLIECEEHPNEGQRLLNPKTQQFIHDGYSMSSSDQRRKSNQNLNMTTQSNKFDSSTDQQRLAGHSKDELSNEGQSDSKLKSSLHSSGGAGFIAKSDNNGLSFHDKSPLFVGNKTAGLTYNNSIVMQFGRISNHEFTCDVTHPLSILQAFSIALSSFDSKLACE